MIEIRTNCENCHKHLPPNSKEAMICGFECTFCKSCVEDILQNVCPNCGGGFEKRQVLPKKYLKKHSPSDKNTLKPVDMSKFQEMLDKNIDIDPLER